jgi:hypothetical protein
MSTARAGKRSQHLGLAKDLAKVDLAKDLANATWQI